MAPHQNAPIKRQLRLQPSFAKEVRLPYGGPYEGFMDCSGACLGLLGSIPCCFCCPNPYRQVQQGTVGLISRFGSFKKAVDPGLIKVNVLSEKLISVDIRMQTDDIPRQYVLTKDNVGVEIDSVLYWDIVDPYVATFLVANVRKALIDRTQTTLRQILGTQTLQASIEHRDTIAEEIQSLISAACHQWGVRVESILIKDIILSPQVRDSMSAAATQKRLAESKIIDAQAEGETKIIAAKAEVNAAKLMREASDILATPAAMQIRFLETMKEMSETQGAKVIFLPPGGHGGAGGLTVHDALLLEQTMERKK